MYNDTLAKEIRARGRRLIDAAEAPLSRGELADDGELLYVLARLVEGKSLAQSFGAIGDLGIQPSDRQSSRGGKGRQQPMMKPTIVRRPTLTHPLKPCEAHGCARLIKPRLLMCRHHWDKVPAEIQERVYLTLDDWKHGASARPYVTAIAEAKLAVAQAENQPPIVVAELMQRLLTLTEVTA